MGDLVGHALQKRPHLRIEKHRNSLDFVFKFEGSVTRALREERPQLYRILFEPRKNKSWTDVLMHAYHKEASGQDKKTVKLWLRFWLNRIFVNAFDVLLSNAISENLSNEDRNYVETEIAFHKNLLKRKSGPRKSLLRREQDAIRFARRHSQLVPQVSLLKAFVLKQKMDDDKVLGRAVEKEFQFDWLPYVTQGEALQRLPMINNDPNTQRSRIRGKWSSWQLSVGILYCEESALNSKRHLGSNTIYKYVLLGKKLLREKVPGK
jgi:hypothetical protein